MTPETGRAEPGLFSRLGPRLALTFGLALLPLAVLNYVQTRQYEIESDARAEAALLGATVRVANPQVDRIMQAQGSAATLASMVARIGPDSPLCDEAMRGMIADSGGRYAFAGMVRPTGRCPAPRSIGRSTLRARSGWPRWCAAPQPTISVNPRGPVSGESVLVFTHPVEDATGRLEGFLTLSAPHRAIAPEGAETTAGGPNRLVSSPSTTRARC